MLDTCKPWNIFNIFSPKIVFKAKQEQCAPGAGKSLLSVENYKICKY